MLSEKLPFCDGAIIAMPCDKSIGFVTETQGALPSVAINPEIRSNDFVRDGPTVFMGLEGVAKSAAAKEVIDRLFHDLGGDALGHKSRRPFRDAIGAVLYDLLRAIAIDPVCACYRPMSVTSFTGQRIGHRNAKLILDRMLAAKLIRRAGGGFNRESMTGTVSRFKPALSLLNLMEKYGVTPSNRDDHFTRVRTPKSTPPVGGALPE